MCALQIFIIILLLLLLLLGVRATARNTSCFCSFFFYFFFFFFFSPATFPQQRHTSQAHTWWRHDDVIRYRITLNQSLIFQKNHISGTTKDVLQSLQHLKDLSLYYISYTDMTLIWPLLPVENGRSRKQIFGSTIPYVFCTPSSRANGLSPTHKYRRETCLKRNPYLQSSD